MKTNLDDLALPRLENPVADRLPNYAGKSEGKGLLALLIGDAGGTAKGDAVDASKDKDASSLLIKGDEVTFFPNFQRAKEIAEQRADDLKADGWDRSDETPMALDFVVYVMRGKARSQVAKSIVQSFGSATPIVCPQDYLIVHDVSGAQRRSCDFYVCKQTPLRSHSRHASDDAIDAAKKWFGGSGSVVGRGVELPNPPWQRAAQIDAIWYRRHAVSGLAGRYEHPYSPSVPLYVSSKPHGWRIALPDGCTVDERGFVYP